MNFCNNCGEDLRQHRGARFCPNCGSQVEQDSDTPSFQNNNIGLNTIGSNGKSAFSSGYNSYGIIYTNLQVLSEKLNSNDVTTLILNYISQLKECGHQYLILDSGNNDYENILPEYGWQSHVNLLKKFRIDNPEAEYVFIIGGHDVIPMAVINNEPACYKDDSEIDTDLPYSYLLEDNFESILWNGRLFQEEVQLYCGRLPLNSDVSVTEFESYLYNSKQVIDEGIETENCFGMTAKSWERASNTIIKNLELNKKLHTSPEHNLNSAQDVFNTYADVYYFNLHGSDSPGSPEFFGDNSPVISPDYIGGAGRLNFLITEACYGAKFIDYAKSECMLLTALNSKTVAYVGSSKVAFGASSEDISSADIIAKSFLDNILSGQSCGRALALARIDVFDACPEDHYDYGTTSAAEFNLFGDPLCSISSNRNKKTKSLSLNRLRSKSFNSRRPEKKEIDIDSLGKGILNDVRNLVNQEAFKIREIINNDLYTQFNIEPRNLSSVFHIKGKHGETTYNYNYYKDSVSGKKQVYSVFADRSGKIKSIIQSK